MPDFPNTLGELKNSSFSEERIQNRSVKDELRKNLIAKLKAGTELFPGILGYRCIKLGTSNGPLRLRFVDEVTRRPRYN